MKYKQLGTTGVLLSELCLGAMTFGGRGYWKAIGQLPEDEVTLLVNTAIDHGINFIDTANAYSEGLSEILLGKVLKSLYGASSPQYKKLAKWLSSLHFCFSNFQITLRSLHFRCCKFFFRYCKILFRYFNLQPGTLRLRSVHRLQHATLRLRSAHRL